MTARIIVVTGTGTDVGKTMAVAAVAAAARARGLRVGFCKPAQTGVDAQEPGDLAEVSRLAGPVDAIESVRYPDPLAPETAAARAGLPHLDLRGVVAQVAELAERTDLVIIEGAGGVLVRLAPDTTILDLAHAVGAQVYIVTAPGLGTLNHTELTVRESARAGLAPRGLILGSWPADPDLAARCNRDDLPRLTGVPIVGVLPTAVGALDPATFQASAPDWVRDLVNHLHPAPVHPAHQIPAHAQGETR